MFLRSKRNISIEDDDLVALSRNGDQRSLGVLFERYAHLLFGVGLKYLQDEERSKDMVMELFKDLPDMLAKHEVTRFKGWVHTVMRNRCLIALRSEKGRWKVELPHDLQEPNDEGLIALETDLQRLEDAIDALKDGQQQCIRAFYLEKNSYQEVAKRTGRSLEQVRSDLQNGRRNLRIILERHADQHRR